MRNLFEHISSRIIKFLTSRVFLVGMVLFFQLIFITTFVFGISSTYWVFGVVINVFNIVLIIRVINQHKNTSYKLAWVLIIGVLPYFGGIIYIMFAEKRVPKDLRGRILQVSSESKTYLSPKKEVVIDDGDVGNLFDYIKNTSGYPYYNDTKTEYFKIGEDYFAKVLEEIARAEHFIFIESFIIKDGYMLKTLTQALKERIACGVKVYMLYDDAGCITCLPENFVNNMKSIGINCVPFSPVSIKLSLLSKSNNRSHRKMIVIDNRVAFTGGYNIADEYINHIVRFGHWKDTGVMLQGDAVWSFTLMFIQFYNASVPKKQRLAYLDYRYRYDHISSDNVVLPFSDSPTDDIDLSHDTHSLLIHSAKKYIYIHTPYLVLDYDMAQALSIKARSGVEVIITVPHIPDKKTVFLVTKANYSILIKAGVKVYEYTPGFIHSKLIIVDDKIASIGTYNMDYRSYYLNYECGVLIAQDSEIEKMKKDYLATLDVSKQITQEDARVNIIIRLFRAILNVFAPLM